MLRYYDEPFTPEDFIDMWKRIAERHARDSVRVRRYHRWKRRRPIVEASNMPDLPNAIDEDFAP